MSVRNKKVYKELGICTGITLKLSEEAIVVIVAILLYVV